MTHSEYNTLNLHDALSQLLRVTYLMADDSRHGLGKLGLTEARAQLLWELQPGRPVTQRDLADRLRVTPRNITTLIDALEETGFVRRDAHPTDRRAVAIVLTEKGELVTAQMRTDFDALAGIMFGDVALPELAAFMRVMRLAATRLSALAEQQGIGR